MLNIQDNYIFTLFLSFHYLAIINKYIFFFVFSFNYFYFSSTAAMVLEENETDSIFEPQITVSITEHCN